MEQTGLAGGTAKSEKKVWDGKVLDSSWAWAGKVTCRQACISRTAHVPYQHLPTTHHNCHVLC